jgi:diaminopimelate epimerase
VPAISVTKCHGTGNDFILLDDRAGPHEAYPALARTLCDRRTGIGADGLLVLQAARAGADLAMHIFNADGSEAEMCGNGIRCVARYVARETGRDGPLSVETLAGIVRTEPAGDRVRVAMGTPALGEPLHSDVDFDGRRLRFARVSMGNPHAVVLVTEPPERFDLERLAAAVARTAQARRGINVEIAAHNAHALRMRVYERGVGETLACGTGASAVAVAAIMEGRAKSPIEVEQRGGSVTIEWQGAGAPLYLTGPAELVFDTTITL